MAQFNGFEIFLPQDVIAQRRAERLKILASGNPNAAQIIGAQELVRGLFGDPDLQRAQELQQRLTTLSGTDSYAEPAGDMHQAELQRLQAMRNTVLDLDPRLASQVEQRMLEVSQTILERNRLLAQDSREEAAADRAAIMFPFDLDRANTQALQEAGEVQNFWKGNSRVAVLKTNKKAIDALINQGYQAGSGPGTETEAGALLTKPTQTKLEKDILSADNLLDQFKATGAKFEPRWLTFGGQAKQFGAGVAEKAGVKLSVPAKADLAKYSEFKSSAVRILNDYINRITGAAMGIQEEKRIRKGVPDPETDSATEFVNKTRATVRELLAVRARAQQAMERGLEVESREDWDSISTPPLEDAQVDALMDHIFPGMRTTEKSAATGNVFKTPSGVSYTVD